MSLSATLTPATNVLSGNPIRLDVAADGRVTFSLYDNTDSGSPVLLYTGSGYGTFYCFLHDIVDAHVSPCLVYSDDPHAILTMPGGYKKFKVVVSDGTRSVTLTFTAYKGGLSRAVLRQLAGGNIFTTRFCSADRPVLFTTRSSGRVVAMRETELSPLPFLQQSSPVSVHVGTRTITAEQTAGTFCCFNPAYLRKLLFLNYGTLANRFDLYVGSTYNCSVVLTPCQPSRDRYYIRFLDSLGCYEVVEFTGTADRTEKPNDADPYLVYDKTVDGYTRERQRIPGTTTLTLRTGYRNEEELLFLTDLLRSPELYLLDYEGRNVRVYPTASNLSVALRALAPASLEIEFTFFEDDAYYSPDDLSAYLGDGRIFVDTFTKEFV